jgi:flagella basal body P-ring formation protein FlgA
MPILELLLAAAGATVTVGLAPAAEVALPGREIRLGDVADLSGLPPAARARLAPRIVAVIPAGRTGITLTRESLRTLVRRSVPALDLRTGPGEAAIAFRAAASSEDRPAPACAELARSLADGAALSNEDLVPVACRDHAAMPPLRFDRLNRVVRAEGAIAAGTYLGRISAPSAVAVDKGDKLSLVASAGPVRVSRDVVALQAGRPGGRLFVRDAEGNVTSAPLAAPSGAGK